MGQGLSIFDICVKITSDFEGTDYDTVTGNFDGMGLSVGLLQWNLGQGTLQSYILNQCDLMGYDFPVCIDPLQRMKPHEAVVWAKDIMHDIHGRMKREWVDAWKRFLTNPTIINLQKRAIDKYFHRAKEICGKLGYSHECPRAMAFSFDVAVQNWSFTINRPEPNQEQAANILQLYGHKNYLIWQKDPLTPDQQILVIAAHLRALQCKPEWRQAVFVRKATIAIGVGIVNGELRDYRKILR